MIARLMIIFEDTKILYFDYPNLSIIEPSKISTTMVTGIIRTKETTMYIKDIQFV